MKTRGRPPTPDVLTPREWEVLSLIRDGLSNREIAERLGISLAGAKFHVSEIISKLGVESREEAASWQPERSRHFFGGVTLPFLKDGSLALTPKLVGAAVVLSLTVAGLGGAALAFGGDLSPSRLLASAPPEPTPTPDPLEWCKQPDCRVLTPTERFTTLQEAAAVSSFLPRLPAYVPAGFRSYSIEYFRDSPTPKDVHNDWLTVYYRDAEGHNLAISQGFPAMPSAGMYASAPADTQGTLDLGGKDAYWLRGSWVGSPIPVISVPPGLPGRGTSALLLTWEVGRFGPGWNISPDRREVLTGSPMSYSIMSDSLPLEELVRIAESVPFD